MSDDKVFGADGDPLVTLGLPRNSDEQDVRRRYLELVRQYPPDREPDKFREIRAAYLAASDPLVSVSPNKPMENQILSDKQNGPIVGIDLGTTNSVVAAMVDGKIRELRELLGETQV